MCRAVPQMLWECVDAQVDGQRSALQPQHDHTMAASQTLQAAGREGKAQLFPRVHHLGGRQHCHLPALRPVHANPAHIHHLVKTQPALPWLNP